MSTFQHTIRLAVLILLVCFCNARSAPLLDDRAITVHSEQEAAAKRTALINYLWGADGFPKERMPVVSTNVPTPVRNLANLERVEQFLVDMAPGLQGVAFHFVPEKPNGELVVVHQGHGCTLDDDPSPSDIGFGLQRTIKALLGEGFGVLGVYMPHMRPGDCTGGHDALFAIHTKGSPLKYFFEPTAISLNYLKSPPSSDPIPKYHAFHMVGLSGGGWTTTVYAAIDPAIMCSFPVAGTIPLFLRSGGSIGDREQFEPSFYKLAGYPDLYILGSVGKGRRQIQILGRKDDCCFGEAQHDSAITGMDYADAMHRYEEQVRSALKEFGPMSFRLEIDETAPSHMISHHAINDIILPELKKRL